MTSEIGDQLKQAGGLVHGGDLRAAEARYGQPKDGWLDLSTGINPAPYPHHADGHADARLPFPAELAGLVAAAAAFFGADPESVAATNGAQGAIGLLPLLKPADRVAVLGPTYAEHEAAWALAGASVSVVPTLAALEAALEGGGTGILVNPNNPDGRVVDRADVLRLADTAAASGALLVVDESFVETVPGLSVADEAGRPGLVVLRSFGKFFGLAGLRVGFLLGERALAERIRALLGPWPLAPSAMRTACAAYADTRWIEATRARLDRQSSELDAMLRRYDWAVVGGTSLFRLAARKEAHAIARALADDGILVRTFDAEPAWIRCGIPLLPAHFARLEATFSRIE